jgi:hypothetical protein
MSISFKDLRDIALKLHDRGLKIIPIAERKRPLCDWKGELSREGLEKLIDNPNCVGIALRGGPVWDKYTLVLVDVDDPSILNKTLHLKDIIDLTVHWYTGPRCPKCYYKHVEVLEPGYRFKCPRCNIEFLRTEAERGIGLAILTDRGVINETRRHGSIELLVNNYQLIPPSLHDSGLMYEFGRAFDFTKPDLGILYLPSEEFKALLNEINTISRGEKAEDKGQVLQKGGEGKAQLRSLSRREKERVVELLKPVYKPGNRQYICLFLSGWAAKAGIDPKSIAEILKMLHEETKDEDDLRVRGSCILYSYAKCGFNVSKAELTKVLGVEPYGPEILNIERVKGKSGLQEILEESLGEKRALEIICEIEEIFGQASPFNDAIFALINKEAETYYVNNPIGKRISQWRNTKNGWVEGRIVVGAYVKSLTYIENIYSDEPEWEALWETADGRIIKTAGPIESHVEKLKKYGVMRSRQTFEEAVQSIFQAFLEKGKADRRKEAVIRGFYLDENGNIATDREDEVGEEEFDERVEKLKLALTTLNEMAKYFPEEVFGIVVKWNIVAPLNYIIKCKFKRYLQMLVIVGLSGTGKTTLALLGGSIWGLRVSEYFQSAENIKSPARFGHYIGRWTYQILFDNASQIFIDPNYYEVRDLLKTAIETTIVRGKHVKGEWKETPSLASIVFTIDTAAIEKMDISEKRRSIIVKTSIGGWSKEKVEEFNKKFGERGLAVQEVLSEIGVWITTLIKKRSDLLSKTWEDIAEEILTLLYKTAGMDPPSWIKVRSQQRESILEELYEEQRGIIVETIHEYVADVIAKYGRKEDLSLKPKLIERIDEITTSNYPSAIKLINGKICIFREFLDVLAKKGVKVASLKDLSELMGWKYTQVHSRRRYINTKVVIAKLEDLEGVEENSEKC